MAEPLTPYSDEDVALIRQRLERLRAARLPFGEGDRIDARWIATLDAARAAAPAGETPRRTHGRHCPCSACARQDWTDPTLAPCGMHGPGCPAVYDPLPPSPVPVAGLREARNGLLRAMQEAQIYGRSRQAIEDAAEVMVRAALLDSDTPDGLNAAWAELRPLVWPYVSDGTTRRTIEENVQRWIEDRAARLRGDSDGGS